MIGDGDRISDPIEFGNLVISDRARASTSRVPNASHVSSGHAQPDGSTERSTGQRCPWLPVSLSLAGVACLVVGGGRVAARKAESLYRCGAILTVVAPTTVEQMNRLVQNSVEAAGRDDAAQDSTAQNSASRDNATNSTAIHDAFSRTSKTAPRRAITLEQREYEAGEAARYRLAIAATGNRGIDRLVAEDATQAGALVNVADDAKPSNMLFPAVCRDGPVSVAVSTEGASPALASWLRNELQRSLPDGLGILAKLLEEARNALHAAGLSTERIDWHDLIDGRTSGSPGLLAVLNTPSSAGDVPPTAGEAPAGVPSGTLSTVATTPPSATSTPPIPESTPAICNDSQAQDRIEEARSYISDYIAAHSQS
ncbi:MAG: precorrin-2 dehydrogenase/sirohydrochlorin ferrochelatase family protein [Acidimicrobiales bacterium]